MGGTKRFGVILTALLVAALLAIAPPAAAAGERVVFVVGNASSPPLADRVVRDLLVGTGFTVELVDDNAATEADADGAALIVISTSVIPGNIGPMFRSTPVPLMTWEPYLYDDLGMTRSGSINRGEAGPRTTIDIVDPAHPLAAGLSGEPQITSKSLNQSFGRALASADIVARVPGLPAKASIFSYDTGDALDGLSAPAARVALFPVFSSPTKFLPAAEDLIEAAALFATSSAPPPPPASNTPPTVDAGPDQTVDDGAPISVDGTVTDDGKPDPPALVTVQWSGPAGVGFGSPNQESSTVSVPGPGTYVLTLSADDSTGPVTDSLTLTVRDPGAATTALFIAANSTTTTAERPAVDRLEALGFDTTVMSDNTATAAAAAGFDLVVISASISQSVFKSGFDDLAVPIVVWEPFVFDDLGLTPNASSQGSASGQTSVRILTDQHPITAGLSGRVTVTSTGRALSWGKPAGAATALASHPNSSGKVAVFALDQGQATAAGTAPARRVALFLAANSPNVLTPTGWLLFDRSVAWATGVVDTNAPPEALASATPTSGHAPLAVAFDGAGSSDDGAVVAWHWDFDDGATATGETVDHDFSSAGSYNVELTVTDNLGRQDTDSITITVTNPPAPPPGSGGPLVRYDFTAGTGRTVIDRSGHGTPLNLTIADKTKTAWLAGGGLEIVQPTKVQSAGSAAKVNNAIEASGEMTIEAWVDPLNVTQSGPARIIALSHGSDDSDPSNTVLAQGVKSGQGKRVEGRFRTSATTGHGQPGVYSPLPVLDGGLVHLVFTRAADGVERLYVDGSLATVATVKGSLDPWDPSAPLALANEPSLDRSWRGVLHLVQIFDRAISSTEVCTSALGGPGRVVEANRSPVGCLSVTGDGGAAPASVVFDTRNGADADGSIVSAAWKFGDGTNGNGRRVTHSYAAPGIYKAEATLTDNSGSTTIVRYDVTVKAPAFTGPRTLQQTSGMRVGNGLFKLDPHLDRETWLGRELNWTSQFTDHRSAQDMGSSSNGLVAGPRATLQTVSDRMNLAVTVGLAFGDKDLKNGGVPAVAANLRKTIAGDYDFLYFRVAERLKDAGYGDAVIRLGHEFNGRWPPWAAEGNEELFIEAWRHVHDLMSNVSPDFQYDWTGLRNRWSEVAPAAYPGDDYVDIVSLSIYWKADGPAREAWNESYWESGYVEVMTAARDFAIAHGKQVGYPEWGIIGLDDPTFINRMHGWFQSLPASGPGSMAYNVYWDSGPHGERLADHPAVEQRYKQLFG